MTADTVTYPPEQEESARGGWYLESRDRFVAGLVLRRTAASSHGTVRVLDAGCGTGGVLAHLPNHFRLVGTDRSFASLAWGARQQRIAAPVHSDVTRLPFPDRCFDVTVSSEVLEHVQDDVQALREVLRVSRREVILTVPAHASLWTDSDDLLLHHRRYSRRELEALIDSANGLVVALDAYGFLPAVMIWIYKRWKRWRPSRENSSQPLASRCAVPGWLNLWLRGLFRLDLFLSERGLIPWGHGWFAVVTPAVVKPSGR